MCRAPSITDMFDSVCVKVFLFVVPDGIFRLEDIFHGANKISKMFITFPLMLIRSTPKSPRTVMNPLIGILAGRLTA